MDRKFYNPYLFKVNCQEELTKKLRDYSHVGFKLLSDEFKEGSFKIKTPSGKILSKAKIFRILRKFEFGNRTQIESLDALDFCHLNEIYYGKL